MKREFSAGGVVFKKDKENTMILLCQHSQHHGWVFPKGLIGDKNEHETEEETALRETREETGITGEIIQPLSPVTYWYTFDEIKREKTVYYFLMRYKNGTTDVHDFEMENVSWVPSDKVFETLTYQSDKQVWKEAEILLKK